jgi:hypothetical protein
MLRTLPLPATAAQQQPPQPLQQPTAMDVGGLARAMLPQSIPPHLPSVPPVSVTAHFSPPTSSSAQAQHQQLLQQHQQSVQMSIAGLGQQPGSMPLIFNAAPGVMQGMSGAGAAQQQQQQQQQQQRAGMHPPPFMLAAQQAQQGAGASQLHPSLLGLPPIQQQRLHMQHPGAVSTGPATSMPQPLMTFGSTPTPVQVSKGCLAPLQLPRAL